MKIVYNRQNQELLPGILSGRGTIDVNKLPGISKKHQFPDAPLIEPPRYSENRMI
jgi:hypothetical protein